MFGCLYCLAALRLEGQECNQHVWIKQLFINRASYFWATKTDQRNGDNSCHNWEALLLLKIIK